MMTRHLLRLCLVALPAAAAGTQCDKLAAMTIPQVRIAAAAVVSAEGGLPEYCRVQAMARPTADSEIHFEVWLPAAASWNGKFQGVGNGGYSGAIATAALKKALQAGYAAASHDTGHSGDNMMFAQGHPEKLRDYAYRAVHVMTENAKLLVRVHYGRFADRAYFVGCSAGGHQALSEAQRYPDDYDGIVAGAPANNRIRQTFAFLWSWMATHPDGALVLPGEKLPLITKAVVDVCDTTDGLKDGLVGDPRKCGFDPAALLCKGAGDGHCLTVGQVEAVRKVYEGVKDPKTGERIFAGWPKGSEDFGDGSWRQYILNPKEPMRADFFRFFLFHDPNWDWRTIQWDRDLAYAENKLGFMQAVDRNLAPFARRGGKLLMYAGWSDPVVAPEDTVRYYEEVTAAMGGAHQTLPFARLFMAPGMGHCSGGPGPNQFDAVGALDQWVSAGRAPEQMVATHATKGTVDRTRPLCPYPQVAKYKGSGSIDEAANFACAAP
ncbi:MAG: tannase/feruloyl esterase family alpha/beta hydrolase [Acidobacteria bacterium]|nr:tannase/feruloyl esterase family alpha/beta hydrolase [Acidobacteriota bacterium]